jgi:hypothetical protein
MPSIIDCFSVGLGGVVKSINEGLKQRDCNGDDVVSIVPRSSALTHDTLDYQVFYRKKEVGK